MTASRETLPTWLPSLVRERRGRRIGAEVRYATSVASTNDLARGWLDAGGPDGLVVVAGRQTAGRGRRGRSWISPEGKGLYTSVGLRPDLPGERTALLTFLGAVAAAEALARHDVDVEIRWPNDLDLDGRKLGGILAETRLEGARIASAVLGIGLNLTHSRTDLSEDPAAEATSVLLARGRSPDTGALLASILERLELWYGLLLAAKERPGAGERLLERWCALAPGHRGQAVEVDAGGGPLRGITEGVEADGALRIRPLVGAGPPLVVRVGDVRRLRPAAGAGTEG